MSAKAYRTARSESTQIGIEPFYSIITPALAAFFAEAAAARRSRRFRRRRSRGWFQDGRRGWLR